MVTRLVVRLLLWVLQRLSIKLLYYQFAKFKLKGHKKAIKWL